MTPIFITDVFLVSADRKREDDDLTELSVPKLPAPDPSGPLPHGNNALSALIVIPEGFCRGSVVSQENSNDRFQPATFYNDDNDPRGRF